MGSGVRADGGRTRQDGEARRETGYVRGERLGNVTTSETRHLRYGPETGRRKSGRKTTSTRSTKMGPPTRVRCRT